MRVLTYGRAPTTGYPYALHRIPRRALPLRLLDYALAARSGLRWADVVYVHSLGLPLLNRAAPRAIKVVGDQAWERSVRRGWIAPTADIDTFQTRRDDPRVTLAQRLRAREVRQADAIIVPSDYLRRLVVGWGADPARVHVIYNALPPDPTPTDLTQTAARDRLGLPAGPLLLTVARLTPWKGVDHLIAVLTAVPRVRLLVAGDGDQLGTLQTQTDALGLADRVTLLGRVPREQLALYFRAADYTALYSGYEGLSHVLLESLRAGTPVIASDKGGNPEVVTPDVNGLLVPYVDRDALAAALEYAFTPGVRDRLAAATATGLHRFDFAAMVEQTATVLTAQARAR